MNVFAQRTEPTLEPMLLRARQAAMNEQTMGIAMTEVMPDGQGGWQGAFSV